MRSLFIRIFLWFWAATVLLVVVHIASVYVTEPDIPAPRWRSLSHGFVRLYGRQAVEAYEHGGCPALTQFFTEQNPFVDQSLRSYLVTSGPKDVCGNQLPADVARLAQMAAAGPPHRRRPFSRDSNVTLNAIPILGVGKQPYILISELPRGRPPLFAIPWHTWAERILVLLFTAGLVCYGLARYLSSPIRRLRGVANRFAQGDLKARIGDDPLVHRRDEIGELGKEFDEMARRIEELVTRQDKLLQSQRRLLGDISHELRSPLTRLGLATGLLHRRLGDDSKPLLDRIDLESERLNSMIGQLLTLARLDAAPVPETSVPVDLKELLESIVADAEFEAAVRSCHIRLVAPVNCHLAGSREQLRSALENVIRNAIRYTADATTVIVELQCTSSAVSITVTDAGPGVPEQDLPHIFEPFYRVAEARDRASGGTGLGLAITERTIRLHGGAVEAFNRPRGGLAVCITFPLSRISGLRPLPAVAPTTIS